MRAVRIGQYGGPEVLAAEEIDTPEPGPGQALVKVGAAGVNFIDVYQRTGRYPLPLPFTPGNEAAGTVVAVGEGVDTVAVGDRVGWTMVVGTFAEHAVTAASRLVPIPDAISDEVGAAALAQGLTAHYLTRSSYPVAPGDTVLVHAAAGGTGLLLTQLATALGARVIGTCSTAEKEKLARAAGAVEVIRYDVPGTDVAGQVRELTGGTGVAAVYDGVGADTFEASLASLAIRGTLVYFGAASGVVRSVDPNRLARGSFFLTRPSIGHHIADRAELLSRAAELFALIADGRLQISITSRYPLAEAGAAEAALVGRRTTGKVLIVP